MNNPRYTKTRARHDHTQPAPPQPDGNRENKQQVESQANLRRPKGKAGARIVGIDERDLLHQVELDRPHQDEQRPSTPATTDGRGKTPPARAPSPRCGPQRRGAPHRWASLRGHRLFEIDVMLLKALSIVRVAASTRSCTKPSNLDGAGLDRRLAILVEHGAAPQFENHQRPHAGVRDAREHPAGL